jgi:hypothetical protein
VSYSVVSLNPHARTWLDEIEYAYDQQVPSRDPTFDDVQKIVKHFQGFEIEMCADIHGLLFSVEYKKDGRWFTACLGWSSTDDGYGTSGVFSKPDLELALEITWRLSVFTGPLVFIFESLPVIISGHQTFDQVLESVAVVYPWVDRSKSYLPSETPQMHAQNET